MNQNVQAVVPARVVYPPFHPLPPELVLIILKYCDLDNWAAHRRMPALIVALRSFRPYYWEALSLFYVRNFFYLDAENSYSTRIIHESALKEIRSLELMACPFFWVFDRPRRLRTKELKLDRVKRAMSGLHNLNKISILPDSHATICTDMIRWYSDMFLGCLSECDNLKHIRVEIPIEQHQSQPGRLDPTQLRRVRKWFRWFGGLMGVEAVHSCNKARPAGQNWTAVFDLESEEGKVLDARKVARQAEVRYLYVSEMRESLREVDGQFLIDEFVDD